MITRIVKLQFKPAHINEFVAIFDKKSAFIKKCKGCISLQLLQDNSDQTIFFTISIWEDSADLEGYRSSDLFKKTWKQIKSMFSEKAQAWSLNVNRK